MDVGKSQRVPPFSFFSALRFFSVKNFPPFIFLMFCDRIDVEKPQRVAPFSFSALWDFFSKIFFLSKGSPFNFFDILQQIGGLKIPKGHPFQFFGIVRLFFENLFLQRAPLQLRQKCWQFRKCPPFSAPGLALAGPGAPFGPFFGFCLSIFEYCKLTLGSPFAIFEP